jgi:hypothetical protein
MALSLTTLATEINTDPRGYGFAALKAGGNDQGIADALNLLRDGTAGRVPTTPTAAGGQASGIISVKRNFIRRIELLAIIDNRDFIADSSAASNAGNRLSAGWWESLGQSDNIPLLNDDGTNNLIRQNLNRILGDTNGTQTRLAVLAKKIGSRAEELFGENVTVSNADVAQALGRG